MNRAGTAALFLSFSIARLAHAWNLKAITVTANVDVAVLSAGSYGVSLDTIDHPDLELDLRLNKLISVAPSLGTRVTAQWGDGSYSDYSNSFDLGLGIRFWPFFPDKEDGFFCGIGFIKSFSTFYRFTSWYTGLGFSQFLLIDAELGWQWHLSRHVNAALRLKGTIHDDSYKWLSSYLPYPSLGFRVGWIF